MTLNKNDEVIYNNNYKICTTLTTTLFLRFINLPPSTPQYYGVILTLPTHVNFIKSESLN